MQQIEKREEKPNTELLIKLRRAASSINYKTALVCAPMVVCYGLLSSGNWTFLHPVKEIRHQLRSTDKGFVNEFKFENGFSGRIITDKNVQTDTCGVKIVINVGTNSNDWREQRNAISREIAKAMTACNENKAQVQH